MIVLRHPPWMVCIVGIIGIPTGILICDPFSDRFIIFPISFYAPLFPVLCITINKYIQTVLPIPENIITASPNDHTFFLFRYILDNLHLGKENRIGRCWFISKMKGTIDNYVE